MTHTSSGLRESIEKMYLPANLRWEKLFNALPTTTNLHWANFGQICVYIRINIYLKDARTFFTFFEYVQLFNKILLSCQQQMLYFREKSILGSFTVVTAGL